MGKIKIGEVKVAFCPTHNMIGDFFTKPLQGTIFAQMHDRILNLPSGTGNAGHKSVLEKKNNRAARKSEHDGKIGPKRSNGKNKGVSTYGTKITPTGLKSTKSLGFNLKQ